MELIPRYNHASKIAFICLVFFIQSYDTLSQLQMQIPPQAAVYSGSTRGYWFEAPADFTIVGLRVPTDASSASQSIAVVRFNGGAPPLYNSTTNDFTILALYQAVQGNSIISVNLPISDGDYIGVLGSRGGNSINSYGANNYSTNIGGDPVTLGRLGMQYDLQSTSPINLWRENSGSISRVELYYSTAGLFSQDSIVACNVDSTQLSPDSSWSNYTWSTGDTTQTTYVSNSGLYYLTVTDTSSNLWTDSVYVNISNPVAQASIVPTDCESTANGVITASGFGGHEPYQYVWSNGSTSASINTLETGLYSLTITDILGCQNDNLFILSALDTIPPSISTQNISVYLDANGEANITASQLNNGSADNCGIDSFAINFSAFDCDDAGVNVVTLTAWDTTGNSSSATANVTILDTLSPIILANHDTIFLDSFGQAILTSSAIDAGTFDNCTLLYTDVSDSLFGCSDVNNAHLVWFIASDIFGNTDSMPKSIYVKDAIAPEIICLDTIAVLNDSGQCGAVVQFTEPTAFDNCSIDMMTKFDSTGLDSGMFFPVGITELSYAVFDQSGNSDTCSVVVEVIDTQAPILLCAPDTQICDSIFTFNLPNYFDNCSELDIQHFEGPASGTFHPVGTTVHRFSILDPSGNSDTCSFEVLRYDYPSIAEAGDNQNLCEEIAIDIEGNTPAVGNGYWTKISGNGIIADTNLSNTTFADFGYGIILLSWNIENGVCPIESDTISINNFSDSATINAGVDVIICDTSSTILSSVKPEIGSYYWNSPLNGASISDTEITNPTVIGLEVGDYEFVWSVINGSCPPGADTVTVSIKPEPVIVSSDSSYIFASSSIDIDASSDIPVNYSWFNSSFAIIDSGSTINIRPESTETYIVQGITEFGCVSFDSVYIQVNESLEIPSAFTPDEDGFNDVWNLKELASYPKCEVRIFNRWGHTLFESTGYDTPWDGTVNGEPLPGGAYFFVIDLKVNELNPLTGSITIIK